MNAQHVYQLLRQVPRGQVTSYKLLAQAAGTKGYRAIGQIVANNPYAPQVPCHRVIKSNGEIGGFRGDKKKYQEEKIKLLEQEGVNIIRRGKYGTPRIATLKLYDFPGHSRQPRRARLASKRV